MIHHKNGYALLLCFLSFFILGCVQAQQRTRCIYLFCNTPFQKPDEEQSVALYFTELATRMKKSLH